MTHALIYVEIRTTRLKIPPIMKGISRYLNSSTAFEYSLKKEEDKLTARIAMSGKRREIQEVLQNFIKAEGDEIHSHGIISERGEELQELHDFLWEVK